MAGPGHGRAGAGEVPQDRSYPRPLPLLTEWLLEVTVDEDGVACGVLRAHHLAVLHHQVRVQ